MCYKKQVRQFHQEKEAVQSEFILGKWDADATALQNEVQTAEAVTTGTNNPKP